MRRRKFLSAIAATAAWPLGARAQPAAIPVIGFLYAGSEATPPLLAAFRNGLAETGHVEGRNVAVEYRWANNALDRFSLL